MDVPKAKIDHGDGYLSVSNGTLMHKRYQINGILGQGAFGRVYQAYDKETDSNCAVKINVDKQEASAELRILQTLRQHDPQNQNRCIKLRDSFEFRDHTCIVTDILGPSIFDFLKGNGFLPFPRTQIQSFARQLLAQIASLHNLDTIHTDLKPQNVLLVDSSYETFPYKSYLPRPSIEMRCAEHQRRVLTNTNITLIDLGSAEFKKGTNKGLITTSPYRAPEILLSDQWGKPCDIWSIGCILLHLRTGKTPFRADNALEHLTMIERVTGGKFRRKLVQQAQRLPFDYPNLKSSKSSKKDGQASRTLRQLIPATSPFNVAFHDLLHLLLARDPKQRLTAEQALEHAWFQNTTSDDGTKAERIRLRRGPAEPRYNLRIRRRRAR